MNYEAPLTSLVWLTSIVSIVRTYVVSYLHDSRSRRRRHACGGSCRRIITCGTLAGAIIPELVKVFTSIESRTCAKS